MSNTGYEPSPHRKVFREAVDVLRRDPILSGRVKRWITWSEGEADPWRVPADGELPCIEIRPAAGPDDWNGPSAFQGPIWLDLVITTAGTNADVSIDLYEAVKRAFYPRDETRKLAVHNALVAAGAKHHYGVRFTPAEYAPVQSQDGDKPIRRMLAGSRIAIEVVDELNP